MARMFGILKGNRIHAHHIVKYSKKLHFTGIADSLATPVPTALSSSLDEAPAPCSQPWEER